MSNATNSFILSKNKKRNQAYHSFLTACRHQQGRLGELVRLSASFMRQEKLYHHFFADRQFRSLALHLALFSLKLPYDYKNQAFLTRTLTEEEAKNIILLLERRIAERIPLAYLTQETSYLGRTFYVNQNVLVPRSLMNTRFDAFLKRVHWKNHRVLDLCTGSGCIGITLALIHPTITVDLADLSLAALEVASINVKRFHLDQRVKCIHSDLFKQIQGKYDLIITNPPYVTDYEYQRQPAEIKNEPSLALKGGKEGLDLVNRILVEAKAYLNPNGILVAELGYGVTKRVKLRYPEVPFEYFCYKKPFVKQPAWKKALRCFDLPFEWSGCLDSIILCKQKDLPIQIAKKNRPFKSTILRACRFIKNMLPFAMGASQFKIRPYQGIKP